MWGRWARFRALRIDEKRLLAVALIWLPIVQVGLRLLGYQRMRQLLSRLGKPNTPISDIWSTTAIGISHLIAINRSFHVGTSCDLGAKPGFKRTLV